MALASEKTLSSATPVSSSPAVCRRQWSAPRSPEPAAAFYSPPKQNGTEIIELLGDLDALQKQYDEGLNEIQEVRTMLSMERKKREAVETTCVDLEREKQRLLKAQLATYERASEQLDYASKYENALQLIKAARVKSNLNNKEHQNTITVLRKHHQTELEDLDKQIMVLKHELAWKEDVVFTLENKLAHWLPPDVLELKLGEAERRIHNSYQDEVEGLKKKLQAEEIRNQNLQSQLQDAKRTRIT